MLRDDKALRATLFELAQTLTDTRDRWMASLVETALSGPQEAFEKFLVSNELWGGSGSIADQVSDQNVTVLLTKLGRIQIAAGIANIRTQMWLEAYEKWQGTKRKLQ